jgi:hypothetical protein
VLRSITLKRAPERNHERNNMIKYHSQPVFIVNFTLTSGEVLAKKAVRGILET